MARSHICFGITSNSPQYKELERKINQGNQRKKEPVKNSVKKERPSYSELSIEEHRMVDKIIKQFNVEQRKKYKIKSDIDCIEIR